MTVFTVVGTVHESLELGHVLGVSKVDHVNGDVVPLETLAQVFALGDLFVKGVTNEDDDTLTLTFVLSVLQRKLSNFDSREEVGISVYGNTKFG